jgi:FERM central domain
MNFLCNFRRIYAHLPLPPLHALLPSRTFILLHHLTMMNLFPMMGVCPSFPLSPSHLTFLHLYPFIPSFALSLPFYFLLFNSLLALWLNPNTTLAEQAVPENAILMYKKKFYYHDGAEDCNNDPVYYNLLFYQSRDAIISNVYSCNMEEAVQLAATLFQINFGDHNPNIHKPGFLKYASSNLPSALLPLPPLSSPLASCVLLHHILYSHNILFPSLVCPPAH